LIDEGYGYQGCHIDEFLKIPFTSIIFFISNIKKITNTYLYIYIYIYIYIYNTYKDLYRKKFNLKIFIYMKILIKDLHVNTVVFQGLI